VKLLSYLFGLILLANRFLFSQIPIDAATAIPPISDGSGTGFTLTVSNGSGKTKNNHREFFS
jgi:hypothetical protein